MSPNPSEPDTALVTLRNTTRTTLRFNLPGSAVNLRPGERVTVVRGHLRTGELKLLFSSGQIAPVVSKLAPSAAAVSPAAAAEAPASLEDAKQVDAKAARAKSRPPNE